MFTLHQIMTITSQRTCEISIRKLTQRDNRTNTLNMHKLPLLHCHKSILLYNLLNTNMHDVYARLKTENPQFGCSCSPKMHSIHLLVIDSVHSGAINIGITLTMHHLLCVIVRCQFMLRSRGSESVLPLSHFLH